MMSALSKLHWRALPPSVLSSASISDLLDAIADDFEETAYQNTDYGTRTPGSDKAWTVERIQETGTTVALGLTPPAAAVDDMRVIIAGHAGSPTPTILTPHTFTASRLLLGVVKGASGGLIDWDGATPYSGGTFSGYWKACLDPTTYTSLRVYESEEAIFVAVHTATTGAVFSAGAIYDSHTPTGSDSEAGGRRVGMMVTGSGVHFLATGWQSSAASTGNFYDRRNVDDGNNQGAFRVGVSNFDQMDKLGSSTAPDANALQGPGGTIFGYPVMVRPVAAPIYGLRVREAFMVQDVIHGQYLYQELVPGTKEERGYLISNSVASQNDGLLLST